MLSTRAAVRAHRVLRANGPAIKRNVRFATDNAAPSSAAGSGALTGGLVGGGTALVVMYGWYQFSGAKSAIQTAQQTKAYITKATDSLKIKFDENTPDTNQALETLKQSAKKYAAFVPGASQYVDTAFNDLDVIRKKHGSEVDNIVSEAYGELRDVSKKGLNMEAAGDTLNVLSKHLERLFSLGGDAAEDILNNHPELKEKLGGSADQLKQLGERLGPEAKKQVDETWQQISDIAKQGLQAGSIAQIYSLVQEKSQKLREMGEQAFNQGFEQVKPMLEKSPKVKQLVEENMDTLKQGNVMEAVNTIRSAVSSGDTGDLEKYLQQAKDKVQQSSSGQLSSWLEMVPNGGQIIPQLQKLREVAEKHGKEAEDLVKETVNDLKSVLEEKVKKANELKESGKQEVSK